MDPGVLECKVALFVELYRPRRELRERNAELEHLLHHSGDAVLLAFCSHVIRHARPSHMLGRIGGEEFLLLMPGTTVGEAEVLLERLHRSLTGDAGIPYTFSAGIAQASPGERMQAVVKRADKALYAAKRGGRDCTVTSPVPL